MTGTFSLIFETSTPEASLAAVEADGRMQLRKFSSDRSHNAALFSPLKELLDARESPEIGLVLVGSGPGSYSGTRVGIAAAQGVAIAADCPAVAVPSILSVSCAESGAPCLVIGDARRGSFWTVKMEEFRLSTEPELTDAKGLEKIMEVAFHSGVPVISFENPSRFPLPPQLQEIIHLEFPDAARLWNVWCNTDSKTRSLWISDLPQPIYLKPPHITPAKRTWFLQPQP